MFPYLSRQGRAFTEEFTRFILVGLLNALATFLIFLILFNVADFHYLLANVLAFGVWVWFGFELQRRWVFRSMGASGAFTKFLVNQIVFTGFGSLLLWLLVEHAQIYVEVAYVVSVGLIGTAIYLASHFWVFRRPDNHSPGGR